MEGGLLGLLASSPGVIVQGATGRQGRLHTKLMLDYGTRVVAGVTPGKGGERVHGVPVYDSVEEALGEHPEARVSVVFVPAAFAADAVYEAVDAGLKAVIVITEHIPVHDTIRFVEYARRRGVYIIGPNTPGAIVPGLAKYGIMPPEAFARGRVAVFSRSGTLTYEISSMLSSSGIGQYVALGVGGDPVVGYDFVDALREVEDNEEIEAVLLIGEIGGNMEERAAKLIESGYSKPVAAYVAGRSAPPGKRMGHAGAIVGATGGYREKVDALRRAGVVVAETLLEVTDALRRAMQRGGLAARGG